MGDETRGPLREAHSSRRYDISRLFHSARREQLLSYGDLDLAGPAPGAPTLVVLHPIILRPVPTISLCERVLSSNPTEVTKAPSESRRLFNLLSRSGHTHRFPNRSGITRWMIMLSLDKSANHNKARHVYGGLERLFRRLRNGGGTGRSRALAPVAIGGGSLAPMEGSIESQAEIGAVPGKARIEDHDEPGLAVPFPRPDAAEWETVTSPNGTPGTQSFGEVARGVTLSEFRRIALSMPETEELNGMGYPSFRTGRKSFATIEDTTAVIRLTRDQQAAFIVRAPQAFAPDSSGWGRLGNTVVRLEVADEATVQVAVAAAWSNITGVSHASEVVGTVGNANEFVKADEVANEISVAAFLDTTEAVDVGEVADEADTAALNVEPRDPLLGVIERLQTFWGDEIKKDSIQ